MTSLPPAKASAASAPAPAQGQTDSWVEAGYILRAHGVHGAMRAVLSIGEVDEVDEADEASEQALQPDTWLARVATVRLVNKQGRAQTFTLSSCRLIHDAVLLSCKEITSRDTAQLWAGASLQVSTNVVPKAQPGEAYIYELSGARVQDMQQVLIGTVHEVLDNAGQPLLVIAGADGEEKLLPLVPETLRGVDREARVLTVCVPEGLWDAS